MKKSLIFCAALFACAFAFQSCDKVKSDNPATVDEATYDLQNLTFAQYIEKHAVDGILTLPADAKVTINEALELTEPLIIVGDEKKPATIVAKAGFVPSKEFTLANVTVDATEMTTPFIALSPNPTADFIAKNDGSGNTDYYGINLIMLENVAIKGLKNSLIWDSNKKYCVIDLTINNSEIELATEEVKNEALIAFQAGGVKDFSIKKSTVVGNNAVAKYFIRFNNSARIDRFGFVKAEDTWSFTYENNTFYGLLKNDGQWGNYNGMVGKAAQGILTINKNIWYNCDAETMRRLNHSKNFSAFNAASTMADNTFWRVVEGEGAAVDQKTYGNGSDLATDPDFKNAAMENYEPYGADQVAKKTGDPRWFVID